MDRLFLFFVTLLVCSLPGFADDASHQTQAVAGRGEAPPVYSRPTFATSDTPPVNFGVPIPQKLNDLFGPNAQVMSASDRMNEELRIYTDDPAYNTYMTEKIHEAADRISDPATKAKFKTMTLKDLLKKWQAENPKMDGYEMAVSLGVLEVGGSSVLGEMDRALCKTTEGYAAQDQSVDVEQDHAGWEARFEDLISRYHQAGYSTTAAENEAESDTGLGASLMAHAQECVRSWWYSPGHRAAMNAYHSLTCHSMAEGNSEKYYCVGDFVDFVK